MPEHDTIETRLAISSQIVDPTPLNAPLPFHKMFFPLGYPLELQTNSIAVLSAAEESWGIYTSRNAKSPLTLRIGVTANASESSSTRHLPVYRLDRNLLSSNIDAHNFVVSDLSAGFSFGWITEETAEATSYLRYQILEAAALCMISSLHATALHAACVAPGDHGMLLCGESGAGKSSLAFAGARAGWTFVSDDASYLPFDRTDRIVVGNCYQFRLRGTSVTLFPEMEGRTITSKPAGKPSIEVTTHELPSVRMAESAVVKSIVLLNRSHTGAPEIVPVRREKVSCLIGKVPVAAPESQAAQEAAIRNLLDVPTYELRYTDLNWAVSRLELLAFKGE
jgi:hypothetical protein